MNWKIYPTVKRSQISLWGGLLKKRWSCRCWSPSIRGWRLDACDVFPEFLLIVRRKSGYYIFLASSKQKMTTTVSHQQKLRWYIQAKKRGGTQQSLQLIYWTEKTWVRRLLRPQSLSIDLSPLKVMQITTGRNWSAFLPLSSVSAVNCQVQLWVASL